MNHPLRALIVEDCEADAQLLVRELEQGGYAVKPERVDTPEALTDALQRAEWDLVFCDHTMPHFSGQQALAMIQQTRPDLPFIYVSGTIGEETAVAAMKAGALDYVMKDKLGGLAKAVERALHEAQVRREQKRLERDRQLLIEELRTALAEVKRLEGLLAICAQCRRVRNERGEWEPMEVYLADHAAVQFSHGLCDECADQLFPELSACRATKPHHE